MKACTPIKVMEPESDTVPVSPSDKAPIEDWFQNEESPLLRYAYTLVKRREVAEEVVQEAFMRLHQHWHEVDQPRPWLYRAVRNLSLNHLRKHKREDLTEREDESSEQDCPDDQASRMEVMVNVRMLMAEMKQDDRELLRLKYEENLSYAHISEKLNIGIGNVGYRLHNVLKTLGDSLRQAGIEGSKG